MDTSKNKSDSSASGIDRLAALIQEATSPYHTVLAAKNRLMAAGFESLTAGVPWALTSGKKYVVSPYGSCLVAFSVGADAQARDGFRIGAAHGDFPGFRIKPRPQMEKDGYIRLNAEGYGGVNHMSWLDRPLSLAGKVVLRSDDLFAPRVQLADLKQPLLTIPNVAVHLQRDMNKGMELKKQTQMLPLIGVVDKFLIRNLFRIADLLNDRDRFTVRGIALAACLFDGKSLPHNVFIDRIIVAFVGGMQCVCHIHGHHE